MEILATGKGLGRGSGGVPASLQPDLHSGDIGKETIAGILGTEKAEGPRVLGEKIARLAGRGAAAIFSGGILKREIAPPKVGTPVVTRY